MIKNINGNELIDFFATGASTMVLTSRRRAVLATACREVLSTRGDIKRVGISAAHVEELLDQLTHSRPQYSKTTLAAYGSRFRVALRLYLTYLDNPKKWVKQAGGGREEGNENYVFPLRQNVLVRLSLPLDLTQTEARRLGAFISSLALRR